MTDSTDDVDWYSPDSEDLEDDEIELLEKYNRHKDGFIRITKWGQSQSEFTLEEIIKLTKLVE